MRTPDEIKKGLFHCGEDGCADCPYDDECGLADHFTQIARDALDYIQQLEDRNEKLENALRNLANSSSNARDKANEVIEHLEFLLAQAERERDAAVHDLEEVTIRVSLWYLDCDYCKDKEKPICENCKWEWRGVCPENTKEE